MQLNRKKKKEIVFRMNRFREMSQAFRRCETCSVMQADNHRHSCITDRGETGSISVLMCMLCYYASLLLDPCPILSCPQLSV